MSRSHPGAAQAIAGAIAVVAVVPWALGAAPANAGPGEPLVATFEHTGAAELFTVPEGACQVLAEAHGGFGGNTSNAEGGQPGRTNVSMALTPGEVLTIQVGGRGGDGGAVAGAGGSFGGGPGGTASSAGIAASGAGGGGASSVLRGETFDDAVAQMESEAGPAEGSGVQHMDLGNGAAGWSNSGIAYVVVSVDGRIVQVSVNLPQDHPLAQDDDALLELTTDFADAVT